jgi:hypothetical protein
MNISEGDKKTKAVRLLKHSQPLAKSHMLIVIVVFALIGGYLLYHTFATAPLVASLEAEQMSPPTGSSVITDSIASGGKALKLLSNGTASGSVSFPSAVTSLTVMARGDQCKGSPVMNVSLDGANYLSNTSVSATSWAAFNVTPASTLNSGTHTLSISFTNAYTNPGHGKKGNGACSRVLYLDVTNFFGPTPAPTPAPTVTLSVSPSSVTAGQSATLTWNSTNATSCTANGAWSGSQPTSGSVSTGALNQNSTYGLTCTGDGGSAQASTTVSVTSTATTDLALNKSVSADSIENSSYPASAAVDGNDSTRWSSNIAGRPDWLQVDLGSAMSFSEIDINWEAAYGTNYVLQHSPDGSSWSTILSDLNAGKAGLIKHTFNTVTDRYVRVYINSSAASNSSIYTLNVYGSSVATTPPPSGGGGLYFASNSVWNTPVGSGSVPATADPNSASWVSLLTSSIGSIAVNQGDYTPTYFKADASTARYSFTDANGWYTDSVPIPSGFKVSPGDGWGIVADSSTNRIYAFTGQPTINSLTTASGVVVGPYNMSGSGTWDDRTGPWLGGASGINYLAGAVLPEDVKAGTINHALSMAFPKPVTRNGGCAGSFVYPASSTDGQGACTSIPMGTHFQLDPSISDATFQSWGADTGDLMILHALQKYGAYVRDTTGSQIALYAANNLLSAGSSTWGYPAGWSNGIPLQVASHLRVLSAPTGTYDSVSTYGQPHR